MKFAGKTKGFTIVEMLTVMGIIAILIGLLVPALNQVKDYAKRVQQKSQFHSMDVALEMFKTEFGSYPESNDNIDILDPSLDHPNDPYVYCGANKMAEALVGLDLLGFHPSSEFRSTGINTVTLKAGGTANMTVYWAYDNSQSTWQTANENIQARKGPFIESENANAFRMDEIYPSTGLGAYSGNYSTPADSTVYPLALCDVYAKRRLGMGNKKTGMPILYYRARTTYALQDITTNDSMTGKNDDIYYFPDNYHLLALGTPETTPTAHPLYGNGLGTGTGFYQQNFEDLILNQQLSVPRPYRANSYILISAGKDGLYGTGDDIFNFDKTTD